MSILPQPSSLASLSSVSAALRVFIIGGSRGLGAAVAEELRDTQPSSAICLLARKRPVLEALQKKIAGSVEIVAFDISREGDQAQAIAAIERFQPTHIWSFVGGGPHGVFESKDFKDHLWAWNVTFLFNARLLHSFLLARARDPKTYPQLKQLLFVGSEIAEAKADPLAASYAAGKHALKGLLTSVQAEALASGQRSAFDIRLVSPGYMKTELLPPEAWPRAQGLAREPAEVAEEIVAWALASLPGESVQTQHLRL